MGEGWKEPDLVVRQAHHEVLTEISVALILSLSKDEGVARPYFPIRRSKVNQAMMPESSDSAAVT